MKEIVTQELLDKLIERWRSWGGKVEPTDPTKPCIDTENNAITNLTIYGHGASTPKGMGFNSPL